jgi:hypothetical protein
MLLAKDGVQTPRIIIVGHHYLWLERSKNRPWRRDAYRAASRAAYTRYVELLNRFLSQT